jgi:ribonucleotide monophosphatase NagD (HAD superfamily)
MSPITRLSPASPITRVVGDFRDKVSYEVINQAFQHIDAGAQLIALQTAPYFYSNQGKNVGTGAFVSLLEYASNTKATLLGKPAPDFFMTEIDRLTLTPQEVCIVGDDITTDIKGATTIGAKSILVKTGKYQDQTGLQTHSPQPNHTIGSIKDLLSNSWLE